MTFATLKAITNASVLNTLADAQVRIAGADPVPGLFSEPSKVANLGEGMRDTSPAVTVASNAVPADPEGQLVDVDGIAYSIVDTAPDGTGLTMLILGHAQ